MEKCGLILFYFIFKHEACNRISNYFKPTEIELLHMVLSSTFDQSYGRKDVTKNKLWQNKIDIVLKLLRKIKKFFEKCGTQISFIFN